MNYGTNSPSPDRQSSSNSSGGSPPERGQSESLGYDEVQALIYSNNDVVTVRVHDGDSPPVKKHHHEYDDTQSLATLDNNDGIQTGIVIRNNGQDSEEPLLEDEPSSPSTPSTMRHAFFTMFPLFMGYAALVTLQDNIKKRLDIGNNGSGDSYEFSFAVSLLYLGNLIFRLMHNVLFSFLRPRFRVVVAYVCMSLATGVLGFLYYIVNSKSMAWVYVAYLLGGVAVGTFEANLISSITPLGHKTKVWAQYGIPIGFNGISVGAFILFASFPGNLNLQCGVYLFIAVANLLGLVFFLLVIPDIDTANAKKTFFVFLQDMRQIRQWFPLIWQHSVALAIDMFAVGLGAAIQLYIYDVSHIPLYLGASATIPENVFRAWFNSMSLIGDAVGRKLAYYRNAHTNPFWFLLFTFAGMAMILSKQAIIAPLGMWCVMFANGSIYAHTTKHIDDNVAREFNLVSLSAWLFVGDAGSFSGSNVVNSLRVLIGGV